MKWIKTSSASTKQKEWQIYNFGKRKVFRLDLNESREGFCRRGRGRSFHIDGPKTENEQEPTVGARNLEAAIESSNPIPRLFECIWTTIESLTTRYRLPVSNECRVICSLH